MKCSWSLLRDPDLGERIFSSGVKKSKLLLIDVFGVDFEGQTDMVSEIEEPLKLQYEAVFLFKGRTITASLNYDVKGDFAHEILSIHESITAEHTLNTIPKSHEEGISMVMDILESEYGVNLSPLDLSENEGVVSDMDKSEHSWSVSFIQDTLEATCQVIYPLGDSNFTVKKNSNHTIYLD